MPGLLRARLTVTLVLVAQLVHAQMAMMSCSSLYLCSTPGRRGRCVVLLPTMSGLRMRRGGVQRVDSGVDALLDAMSRLSTVVASRWVKVVAGAGSVRSSAGT